MSWASKTYSFSPSTTIRSAEVNQNFTDMVDQLNEAVPASATGCGIILFSGAVADIPSGWYLCNGSNGTPDLRDKFIVGAGSSYAVGATGGSASVTLNTAQIPAHTHTGPSHTHGLSATFYVNAGGGEATYEVGSSNINAKHQTLNTGAGGTGNTGSTGGGGSHENRPPYYALAWIMKSY